jgi:alkylhydroperoxidase/carboxymuconolactone decarboxylase family protein YurZ
MQEEKMTRKQTPWFMLHSPEIGKAFESFYKVCEEDGVLDKKTKELLMLALTSVFRSINSIDEHLDRALKAGATKEEITETLLITAAEGAWAQLAFEKQLCLKYLGEGDKKLSWDSS